MGTDRQRTALLLVDDHAIVRQGLAALLSGEADFEVCGEAGTYEEGLAAAERLRPDCVILDLSLRDRSGLEWIREARDNGFRGRILVLSMHDEGLYAEKALRAGAQGYVMKDQAEETLVAALRQVRDGGIYLSPAAEALLAGHPPPADETAPDGFEGLTARESEILHAIGGGMTTREIAERFGLSGRTVDVHRASIKRKLGCASLAEVLVRAADYKRRRDAAPLPPAL
ncbi:MAG TPA: response regulator transcription factor [Kiritimatiellia bacterium]|nr:response regulator transcription factor [Kiritimatiellia bacterium]HPC57591.1 response regulator transcription factor [Kiritimatiellia bacterium]